MSRNIAKDGAWHYNKAHDQYPVKTGESWTVGRHWFVCGDLQEENRLEEVINHVDDHETDQGIMYVDPPWDKRMAHAFRTKAGVEKKSVDLNDLFWAILEPARKRRTIAFMEGGNGKRELVIDLIQAMGGVVGNVWEITYYKKKPCFILAADFRDQPRNDFPDLTGLDDEQTPKAVLDHYSVILGDTKKFVVDPCGGRGLTARTAEQCGWTAITLELSPYRMAEAMSSVIKTIKKLTGETVEPERQF